MLASTRTSSSAPKPATSAATMLLAAGVPLTALRALATLAVLATLTVLAALGATSTVAMQPASASPAVRLAYTTESARSSPAVWVADGDGSQPKRLGPGGEPLLAPDGQSVAASMLELTANSEQGPALVVYSTVGAAPADYLNLATVSAQPLAWSPDSRYLAIVLQSTSVVNPTRGSGLDVVDTHTGAVTSIAAGAIFGASFARDGSDRVVFGLSRSLSGTAPTDLYLANPDGSSLHRLTSDGRSLNPVWGPADIAYDRERLRSEAPSYQIWLESPAGVRVRQVTHVAAGPLVEGLVPLAFSADASKLLAEFEGQDTSEAWAVNVSSGHARRVSVHAQDVQGAGISSDGRTLLIDENAFEQPASHGRIVTVPFAGGPAKVLVKHGSQATWNG